MATGIAGYDDAIQQFESRLGQLRDELGEINRELGRVDLLALAARTSKLLRSSRGLLDGNVTVLFEDNSARAAEDLYRMLEYAEGHVAKALGDEYDFEIIKRRLYMATALSEYVIAGVHEAVQHLKP